MKSNIELQSARNRKTITPLEEQQHFDDNLEFGEGDSLIEEKEPPKLLPNISKIYGVSYGVFEDVIKHNDRQQKSDPYSRVSIFNGFDFNKHPFYD